MGDIVSIPRDARATGLLEASGLPSSDLEAARPCLFGMIDDDRLVGMVGLEVYGEVALLRSLAVAPDWRASGLGSALVQHAEGWAAAHGVADVFLLTTTASTFFGKRGYEAAPRDEAPAAIATTSQFSGGCCSSAAFMRRRLGPAAR